MAKKYSYWLDSGKYSMLQKICTVVSGLVTFMILARLFTPEKYSVWGLFMVISAIVETLRHALIKNGYILFINTCSEEDRPGYEYAALATNITFSIFLAVFFLLTANFFEDILNANGLAAILRIYTISLLLLIPYTHREFSLLSRMDFRRIFFIYLARYGSFLLAAIVLFILQYSISLTNLTLIYAGSITAGVILMQFFTRNRDSIKPLRNISVLKKFLHYGKYVLGTNFSSMVFRNTDSFMTAHFISPLALAYYNTSTRIINFAEMPTLVIGEIMYPKASRMVKTGTASEISNIYEKSVAAALTLVLPFALFVFVFPELIIHILAGKQYLEAAPILRILILFTIFIPFVNQFGNIMDVTGKPRVNFLVTMSAAIFNITANLLLIPTYGMFGPAISILSSYILLFLITQILLYYLAGVSLLRVIKNIFHLYGEYFRMGITIAKVRILRK